MKRYISLAIVIFLTISSLHADGKDVKQEQPVHQYLVREAYNLLKFQLGYDVPEMVDHVGNTQTGSHAFNPGGFLVIGAWREDEEDLVYGYNSLPKSPYHTCTHFWKSDDGDGARWTVGIGTWENAYEKANKYIYGANAFSGSWIFNMGGISYCYDSIFHYYKHRVITAIISPFKQLIRHSSANRDKIAWEVLGRVCHLLGDMGMPAYAHNDAHPSIIWPFGDPDAYEIAMRTEHVKSNYLHAAKTGGIINVIGKQNPLKYLFYTTNQIAQFFPSKNSPGNNTYGINEPFSNYPPLQEIINGLGPVPTSVNVDQIRETAFVYSMRAAAGLLFWFAVESGLILVIKVPQDYTNIEQAVNATANTNYRVIYFRKFLKIYFFTFCIANV